MACHSIILATMQAALEAWKNDTSLGLYYLTNLRVAYSVLREHLKPGARAVFEVALNRDISMIAGMMEEAMVKDGKN